MFTFREVKASFPGLKIDKHVDVQTAWLAYARLFQLQFTSVYFDSFTFLELYSIKMERF